MTGKKSTRFEHLFVCALLAVGVAALMWGLAASHFQLQKSPYPSAKYSRADCIVRIDITYPEGYKTGYMVHMRRIIMDVMKETVEQNSLPIGAGSFGEPTSPDVFPETEPLYIQFYDKCENKMEMAQQLVVTFDREHFDRQAAIEPGEIPRHMIEKRLKPILTVSEDRIEPSLETIFVRNDGSEIPPVWTDVDDR